MLTCMLEGALNMFWMFSICWPFGRKKQGHFVKELYRVDKEAVGWAGPAGARMIPGQGSGLGLRLGLGC